MLATAPRALGRSGITLSPLGLGCWAIGGPWQFLGNPGGWGEVDDDESIRAIHTALDLGVNFFDSAANYGAGHSERVLGRALADRRGEVVIATKFGWVVDEEAKRVTPFPRAEEVLADVRGACEASLRRLGTDYIDLYQLHVWDYPLEFAPALLDELEELVREGKIRAYGWSTDEVENARLFARGAHCEAIQHDLNVMMDAPEMLALCEAEHMASVNRSPLARGALTGKYAANSTFAANDVRTDAWSRARFFVPTLEKLDALREILTSDGRTLAQGALAWIWARSPNTVPIPGFRTVQQVQDNAGAMDKGPLTAQQMAEIQAIVAA